MKKIIVIIKDQIKMIMESIQLYIKNVIFYPIKNIYFYIIIGTVIFLPNYILVLLNAGNMLLISLGLFSILQFIVNFLEKSMKNQEYYLGYSTRSINYYMNLYIQGFLNLPKRTLLTIGLLIPTVLYINEINIRGLFLESGIVLESEIPWEINPISLLTQSTIFFLKKVWLGIFALILLYCVGMLFESVYLTSEKFSKTQKIEEEDSKKKYIEKLLGKDYNKVFKSLFMIKMESSDDFKKVSRTIQDIIDRANKVSGGDILLRDKFLRIVFTSQRDFIDSLVSKNKERKIFKTYFQKKDFAKLNFYYFCKWFYIDDLENKKDYIAIFNEIMEMDIESLSNIKLKQFSSAAVKFAFIYRPRLEEFRIINALYDGLDNMEKKFGSRENEDNETESRDNPRYLRKYEKFKKNMIEQVMKKWI